ncbi:hypothetical protein EV368DRAFT_36283 [Lentinula lateritia]|nr:hypothetical protein EV368DRAFT_36283 [Lentinula lateritia]
MAIQHWYEVTPEFGNLLSSVFNQEWPDKWEEAMKRFKAGKWQAANPGPWVGKAIVYKLTSSIHPDEEDAEECPTVTVPVGHFVGGHIQFLDIHARLQYSPGHIVIGLTSILFHRVEDWTIATPSMEQLEEWKRWRLTPGRIGIVSFFPRNSYNLLNNKEAHWGADTQYGRREELLPKSKRRKIIS